jgi:hypothetical protein
VSQCLEIGSRWGDVEEDQKCILEIDSMGCMALARLGMFESLASQHVHNTQ